MRVRRLTAVVMSVAGALVGVLALGGGSALAAAPPAIEEESVLNVTSTSAVFEATVNPGGAPTTYHVEYDTSEYTSTAPHGTSIPAPNELAGTGTEPVSVQMFIQGLSPATVYHYRLVATNEIETVTGADRTFTTQNTGTSSSLPDGRQYELVSPPVKDGTRALRIEGYAGGGVVQASEDGNGITYLTSEPPELDAPANSVGTQLLSSRGPEGWTTRNISLPNSDSTGVSVGEGSEYRAFSTDLSIGLVTRQPEQGAPPPGSGAPEGYDNSYLVNSASGQAEALMKLPFIPKNGIFSEPSFSMHLATASPDLRHIVVYTSEGGLSSGMPPNKENDGNLYEWTAGRFESINILPDGAPDLEEGTDQGTVTRIADHGRSISDDGSRVVWADSSNLYVRKDIGTPQVETALISPEAGNGGSLIFRAESSDGSRVFFTRGNTGTESLFEYDVETGSTNELAGDVSGVVGVDENGDYVYFVSTAVLGGGRPGAENLYVWHEDKTRFIATLAGGDEQEKDFGKWELGMAADWAEYTAWRTARVTPDGEQLVFLSREPLTGYDNTVVGRDSCGGVGTVEEVRQPARCEEVFHYDATSGRLICVSCNPDGARPTAPSGIVPGTPFQNGAALYDSRPMSNNGGRVFFDSGDALVPADTNGQEDVYEWEEIGEGTCGEAGGCVSLISTGKGSERSSFLDASIGGNDVFFLTADELVNNDDDDSYDVYDARECSQQAPCPAIAPVAPPPCDTGDGCRPAPSPEPTVFGVPASATFTGSGNPTAPVSTQTGKSKKKIKGKSKSKSKRKARHTAKAKGSGKRTGRGVKTRRSSTGRSFADQKGGR